jgi:CBS domain containing-hemolysin-like protein
VPETLTSVEVWERLDEAQSYLAIVLDEYGGTSGLITREDLIEELFGELQDEFDEEQALITPRGADRINVRGDLLISVLNDRLEINLPTDTSHTVGGLVMDILGRIPQVGDTVEAGSVRLWVEGVEHRSVTEVCVQLLAASPHASTPGGEQSTEVAAPPSMMTGEGQAARAPEGRQPGGGRG